MSRSIKDYPLNLFEDKYTPEPTTGCWLWHASRDKCGYGTFGMRIDGKTKKFGAHRYAWTVFKGDIPEGISVLHKCDTPSCVNPDHLFIGTQLDNVRDQIAKGRYPSRAGTSNANSRLSREDVAEIRRRTSIGEDRRVIAAAYGIYYRYVDRLAKRECRQ